MEAKAVEKYLRISSRKVKYIIDMVKDKKVEEAMDILLFTPRMAASAVRKAIQSASANAVENFKEYKVNQDDLFIKEIFVTEGPTLKRFKPRARGRADKVLKRTSHITVIVADGKDKDIVEKERAARSKAARNKNIEKKSGVKKPVEKAAGKKIEKEKPVRKKVTRGKVLKEKAPRANTTMGKVTGKTIKEAKD